MDEQKQIEEMAKVIRPILENRIDIGFIPDLDKPIAEEIYNTGCRIIPEGAVVLTEDCHKALVQVYEDWRERCTGVVYEARKETAREIFELLQECSHQASDTIILDIDDFYKIAKCYEVEVEE